MIQTIGITNTVEYRYKTGERLSVIFSPGRSGELEQRLQGPGNAVLIISGIYVLHKTSVN